MMLAGFRSLRSSGCVSSIFNPVYQRTFSTTVVRCAKKVKGSGRRIPSKKAAASKQKRRDATWIKEENSGEKLPLNQAIQVLRAVEVMRPRASYELVIKTKLGNGMAVPKGRFDLPKKVEIKSDQKILVFADGKKAEEAKQAGAHIVGGVELIEPLLNNQIRPTTVLCIPSFIKPITPKLGRHLGPLGLMPSERRGTVTDNIAGYIQQIASSGEWKANSTGSISVPVARMDFTPAEVVANIRALLDSVKIVTGNKKAPTIPGVRLKEDAKRVIPIGRVLISSTQGPSIRLADP